MGRGSYRKTHKNIIADDYYVLNQLKILGRNIRKLRKYYKITQREFCSEILLGRETNNASVSCKERCTVHKKNGAFDYFTTIDLILISKYFNITIADLFNGNFEEASYERFKSSRCK